MKTMLTAKVLVDKLPAGRGLYLWLVPNDESTLGLAKLVSRLPTKPLNATKLHCTVLHSKSDIPSDLRVPVDAVISARAIAVDLWINPHETVLVLRLQCPQLEAMHESFVAQGMERSYEEYSPHITLAKDFEATPDIYDWIKDINARLAAGNFIVTFDPSLKASGCN